MKNKFSRLISALLIFAFLISAFSIFTFAAEGEEETEEYDVYYNRTYEEGWNYTNGLASTSGSAGEFSIDYEEDETYRYNYFVRAEAVTNAADSVYVNFGTHVAREGKTVVEVSIKADDVARLGRIMYLTTGVYGDEISLLEITSKDHLVAFPSFVAAANASAKSNTDCHPTLVNGHCATCGYCNHGTTQPSEDGSYRTCLGCGANYAIDLGVIGNEWIDIAFIFDWGEPSDGKPFTCEFLWGEDYENSANVCFGYEVANDKGIKQLHFGFAKESDTAAAEKRPGMSFCFDNLKVYQGVSLDGIKELDPTFCGELVGLNDEKTINIQQGAGFKSKTELLEEALCMKLGVNYALFRNERRAVYDGTYGAPVKDEKGNVMISLDLLLEYIGYPYYRHPDLESYDITTGVSATYITAGRDSATVAGKRIDLTVAPTYYTNAEGTEKYLTIAVADVESLFPGFLSVYDEMGLIIIYEDITPENLDDNQDIVNRDEDLDVMVSLMQRFLFDTVKEETTEATYTSTANKIINDTKNKGAQHPYLVANQSTFDKLAEVYSATDATAAKRYLEAIIAEVDAFYSSVANVSGGSYAGIKSGKSPVNPYTDGLLPDANNKNDTTKADTKDGYNGYSGRLTEAAEYSEYLTKLAFAYQVTGDSKYALLAYDWAVALANWEHWGPGFFTDCATAVSNYALAYDWLYNAYKALGKDTDVLAKAIFDLGIHDGYVSSTGAMCEHPRSLGDKSYYNNATDNTNVIGTSGMVIAVLATIDYVEANEAMQKEAIYVLGNNVINLINNGLGEYAPDGAYIESPTYWEQATHALFRMVMALDSAAGNDYGFMDTWGINKTCYYAAHIESSDGFIWNYNDSKGDGFTAGELASLDTSMFNFVGTYLGDETIVAFRQKQLESGKKAATIYDMLFYPFDGVSASGDLPLDYHMDGIEGFVSRSDWNDGALYTGIMGGQNGGKHVQADSGNFIYHNKGIVWFMDLGSDNENLSDYNGSAKYKYYRASGEGNNVVIMHSNNTALAAGQVVSEGGQLIDYYSNEAGSYAIINNVDVYSGLANTAYRGLFVTNDRKTVVIQDEMAFKLFETVYWVAQTAENIHLDESGTVAFLTSTGPDGETYVLRATLVSQFEFYFTVMDDISKNILDNTKANNNLGKDDSTEYSRTGLKRLVIESKERISFNVAVVFEIVSDYENTEPVGYKWTSMDQWMPYASDEFDANDTVIKRDNPKMSDIKTYTNNAESLLKRDTCFTSAFDDLYAALTRVGYTVTIFDPDELEDAAIIKAYDSYKSCVKTYNKYLKYVEDISVEMENIANKLIGFEVEIPTEE